MLAAVRRTQLGEDLRRHPAAGQLAGFEVYELQLPLDTQARARRGAEGDLHARDPTRRARTPTCRRSGSGVRRGAVGAGGLATTVAVLLLPDDRTHDALARPPGGDAASPMEALDIVEAATGAEQQRPGAENYGTDCNEKNKDEHATTTAQSDERVKPRNAALSRAHAPPTRYAVGRRNRPSHGTC